MKKSTLLLYAAGLVTYSVLSKSLKNKDSKLSRILKKSANKATTLLNKFTQKDGMEDKKEISTKSDKDNKSTLKNASKIGATSASSAAFKEPH